MKVTYKGEYAIRALLYLCSRYPNTDIVPIGDISRRQNIPEKYLEQILLILKKSGHVASKRGANGGFYLPKAPAEITLGEIIRTIEGSLEPVSNNDRTNNLYDLALREIWQKVTQAISAVVDTVTFADIMRRAEELRQVKNEYNYDI
ncbi:MAG TPA: Rrf2 family transcriptional regulator [bacterium]|nr:Rrf2 family transcriptional regulator [bacterium]HPN45050.1 Rrf2 family transcriptional regulator [bacterium]